VVSASSVNNFNRLDDCAEWGIQKHLLTKANIINYQVSIKEGSTSDVHLTNYWNPSGKVGFG